MSELSKRIIQVQTELKAPKDQYNDFGKFYYRSAESILETLKPLLAKHELLQVISDEIVLSGDWHYIKATVTVSHGEESLSVSALAESRSKKSMDESQSQALHHPMPESMHLTASGRLTIPKTATLTNIASRQKANLQPARESQSPLRIPNLRVSLKTSLATMKCWRFKTRY